MHGSLKQITTGDLDLAEEYAAALAREDFWAFRLYMNKNLIKGWWQNLIAIKLQEFYNDLLAGKRPSRLFSAPPQHGKSTTFRDFCAWIAGRHPDWAQLYSSYSDELCTAANLHMQRYLLDPRYLRIFPDVRVKGTIPEDMKVLVPPQRNTEVIDFARYRTVNEDDTFREIGGGSFRNPTVDGQATGFGCMLGIVDDPLKGRAEAQSPTIRGKKWNWLMDDFFTRFADQAGLLMIMTRWHTDDPGGRFLEAYPDTEVIAFPAVAIKDEYIRIGQERRLLRRKGEALFPEHKTLDFLLKRKQGMSSGSWESIYQQSPIIVGGGEFPVENFEIISAVNKKEIKKSVRYWDKAGTQDGGKYTAGVLMHSMRDGTFVIEDCVAGQWSALPREQRILQTAQNDKLRYMSIRIYVEQEPGSGGKESAEATIRMLRGFRAYADKVSDSKGARAEPYAAQVQNSGVKIVAGDWVRSFLDQHEVWPNGPLKDKVDAAAGAFNKLVVSSYDTSNKWVG